MSTPAIATAGVLADRLSVSRVHDVALVLGGTASVALAAQIIIPLGFTPVPLSLATFAVILTGAALGPAKGALSLGLYMALGLAGAPVFADGGSGWVAASFGYIVGYVLAAAAAGALADRGFDRTVGGTALLVLACSALIYSIGLPWLMVATGADLGSGLQMGVLPFLIGDAIKGLAAMALLPSTWRLIGRR
ncbi:biotin transporter BioY [Flaviflexus huanghaiensis]|uniref:biotin transporter BioY n=1 Tax=Flaviflexus huanghaiensis TaxID=1111473 RepID=UPI0015FCF390